MRKLLNNIRLYIVLLAYIVVTLVEDRFRKRKRQ